jgi:hypothetical protein
MLPMKDSNEVKLACVKLAHVSISRDVFVFGQLGCPIALFNHVSDTVTVIHETNITDTVISVKEMNAQKIIFQYKNGSIDAFDLTTRQQSIHYTCPLEKQLCQQGKI